MLAPCPSLISLLSYRFTESFISASLHTIPQVPPPSLSKTEFSTFCFYKIPFLLCSNTGDGIITILSTILISQSPIKLFPFHNLPSPNSIKLSKYRCLPPRISWPSPLTLMTMNLNCSQCHCILSHRVSALLCSSTLSKSLSTFFFTSFSFFGSREALNSDLTSWPPFTINYITNECLYLIDQVHKSKSLAHLYFLAIPLSWLPVA